MQEARNARFIQKTLYKLRNDYGINNIGWYHIEETVRDYETGNLAPNITKYNIQRAVSLPAVDVRRFSYALSFMGATGPNFAYGGYFDANDRILIIRVKDLISSFTWGDSDYIIIKHKRYELKRVQLFDVDQCMMVHIREVKGGSVIEWYERTIYQTLTFEGESDVQL